MQFLSISQRRPGFGDKDFEALSSHEVRRARELYSAGLLRHIWHRGDRPGACIIWEADNEARVREMLDSLPFAKMLDIEIIPLVPYRGFAPG